jgi:hypothetical protein
MNKKDIAIATMCWARNDDEEKLLKASLFELNRLNIPVFITDGGSGIQFLEFIKSLSNFILLEPAKGVWLQTRSSLNKAYDAGLPFIFYTEPDKTDFFIQSLPDLLENINVDEGTGIVLASRSKDGFTSFPDFQRMTETTINNCCKEILEGSFDYVYGPFLLNRNVVPFLKHLKTEIGWGWRPYSFNIAKRLGLKVNAFEGDFLCPIDQREDTASERIYRMKQLLQNIDGLTLSTIVNI